MKIWNDESEAEHRRYLSKIVEQGAIREHTAIASLLLLDELRADHPDLPMPDAGPGPDGEIVLIWNNRPHDHFSVEIGAGGGAAFFYGDYRGEPWLLDDETPIKNRPTKRRQMAVFIGRIVEAGRANS